MGKSNRNRFRGMCWSHGLKTLNTDHESLIVYKETYWNPIVDIPYYDFKDPDWDRLQEILTSCVLISTFDV